MVERYLIVTRKFAGILGVVKVLSIGGYHGGTRAKVIKRKDLYVAPGMLGALRHTLRETLFLKDKFITSKGGLFKAIFGRVA